MRNKTDGEKIVQELIIGPEAIDQMRKEINSVVKLILGFLNENEFSEDSICRVFTSVFYGCQWRIAGTKNGQGKFMTWNVQCCLNVGSGWAGVYFVGSGHSNDNNNPNFKYVQIVREGLGVFVEGMAKTFPFLNESWRPILDAADYAKKNGIRFKAGIKYN